jgi:YggT family protein
MTLGHTGFGRLVLAQTAVGTVLCAVLQIYLLILLVRVILSWVPSLPDPLLGIARGVRALTDPVLEPLRRVIPPLQLGGVALDLSVILLFLAIRILLMPIACSL